MSKTRTFLFALAALLLGVLGGGWGASRFWERVTGDWEARSMMTEAGSTVGLLKRLRAGNSTGAVEVLEYRLDSALLGLGALLPSIPESRRDRSYLKAIQKAKDYRTQFPRTNESPEITEGVARAFTLLDGKVPH